jgi:hypothetical protein
VSHVGVPTARCPVRFGLVHFGATLYRESAIKKFVKSLECALWANPGSLGMEIGHEQFPFWATYNRGQWGSVQDQRKELSALVTAASFKEADRRERLARASFISLLENTATAESEHNHINILTHPSCANSGEDFWPRRGGPTGPICD